MLQVIDSGRQAVMLAPTEVLAAQHARSLRDVLGPLGRGGELGAPPEATAITLLTGSLPAQGPQARAADDRVRAGRHRRRHPRAAVRGGVLRQPRADRGRRAAPVRRRAAARAADQASGRQPAARAGDDGDPDPAHGGDDGLRRPGHLDAVRAAAGPVADRHHRGAGRRDSRPGWSGPGSGSARRSRKGHQAYVVCPKIGDDDETEMFEDGSTVRPGRRRATSETPAGRRWR